MRKRSDIGHAAILFVMVIFAAAFAVAAFGCGAVAGIGRDLTAMADGLAGDSAANAEAIRGKGK